MIIPLRQCHRHALNGSSVLIVLVLIAVLFLHINATLKTLHVTGRSIALVEKRQVAHWQQFRATNAVISDTTNALPQIQK